jgi:hypothetical protein
MHMELADATVPTGELTVTPGDSTISRRVSLASAALAANHLAALANAAVMFVRPAATGRAERRPDARRHGRRAVPAEGAGGRTGIRTFSDRKTLAFAGFSNA